MIIAFGYKFDDKWPQTAESDIRLITSALREIEVHKLQHLKIDKLNLWTEDDKRKLSIELS